MSLRRTAPVLAAVPLALVVVSVDDVRMPDTLARQPAPVVDGCYGDIAGLSPVHYRFNYVDGTTSSWLSLDARVGTPAKPVASQTVRDGLGRTRTVRCRPGA